MSERIIKVKVLTKASANRVEQVGQILKVYTTSAPEKDKANKSVIKLLADFFGNKPSHIQILTGKHSREKIIKISNPNE